ncbi:two-component system response regulator [Bacillus sp. MUM 116]|uniref:response regulator n=1 Tax=Bacillus sp. MUM 116 TaxID=1678002 RepID=UPI0008F5A4AD|nr:response regulator [Bacillus sp. MUM 116]OIK10999.1 two-component system response regulator [Bacillus sp. MUM 116]
MARILIVDDKSLMRNTLKTILNKTEHVVVGEAETGLEAVQLYKELKPDLVTMDITMPEMSGIDAIKSIRQDFPEARVIMCSAMGQQKIIMEAIEAGAKDFIVKPFDDCRVMEALNRALK